MLDVAGGNAPTVQRVGDLSISLADRPAANGDLAVGLGASDLIDPGKARTKNEKQGERDRGDRAQNGSLLCKDIRHRKSITTPVFLLQRAICRGSLRVRRFLRDATELSHLFQLVLAVFNGTPVFMSLVEVETNTGAGRETAARRRRRVHGAHHRAGRAVERGIARRAGDRLAHHTAGGADREGDADRASQALRAGRCGIELMAAQSAARMPA